MCSEGRTRGPVWAREQVEVPGNEIYIPCSLNNSEGIMSFLADYSVKKYYSFARSKVCYLNTNFVPSDSTSPCCFVVAAEKVHARPRRPQIRSCQSSCQSRFFIA